MPEITEAISMIICPWAKPREGLRCIIVC